MNGLSGRVEKSSEIVWEIGTQRMTIVYRHHSLATQRASQSSPFISHIHLTLILQHVSFHNTYIYIYLSLYETVGSTGFITQICFQNSYEIVWFWLLARKFICLLSLRDRAGTVFLLSAHSFPLYTYVCCRPNTIAQR